MNLMTSEDVATARISLAADYWSLGRLTELNIDQQQIASDVICAARVWNNTRLQLQR